MCHFAPQMMSAQQMESIQYSVSLVFSVQCPVVNPPTLNKP